MVLSARREFDLGSRRLEKRRESFDERVVFSSFERFDEFLDDGFGGKTGREKREEKRRRVRVELVS